MAEGGVGHEENDFSPDFREYMEREHYDISRVNGWFSEDPGWVFWDRRDGYPDRTLPNYHYPDINPDLRIRLKIRGALCKLMLLDTRFRETLFQFWAPLKTVEGRTYLTVQNQPFAFGFCNSSDHFCQCRTRICNLVVDAHAEYAEEQLGLPAHVFVHKLPEAAPYPSYNTLDLASRHRIKGTWALPVFENNNSACVGVLEIATCFPLSGYWDFCDFLDCTRETFQEFGLSCMDEYKHCIMQWEDRNEAHIAAFKELEVACKSLCVLPWVNFSFAWVFSRSCSDLLRGLFKLPYVHRHSLFKSPGIFHMRKVHIIGSEVPISSLSCCWDIGGLNLYKFLRPIDAYTTSWFTMCLQSRNTAELYVVQLYLSMLFCNPKNKLSKLRLIMDTMKGHFSTFRLAYGQEWGEELPLAVIDYRKDQKNHHIEMIPATGSEAQNSKFPSLVSLPNGIEVMRVDSSDQKSHSIETIPTTGCIPSQRCPPSEDSVNNGRSVSTTEPQNSYTISDPSHNSLLNDSDPNHDSMPNGIEMMQVDSSDQASVDPSNSFEDQEQSMEVDSDDQASAIGGTVTVKAKVKDFVPIRQFSLSSTPTLVELQQKLAERDIDTGAYDIFHTDNKGEKPIGCDNDLQQLIDKSRLLGDTWIGVFLRPKQPSPP